MHVLLPSDDGEGVGGTEEGLPDGGETILRLHSKGEGEERTATLSVPEGHYMCDPRYDLSPPLTGF